MLSLMYLSRSKLDQASEAREIKAILEVAVQRNLRCGVTGALVYSGNHFAQVLEGPETEVAQIMGNIMLDPRHDDVRVLSRETIPDRSFPNWGMAQVSSNPDLESRIRWVTEALNEADFSQAISSLLAWMRQGASARV